MRVVRKGRRGRRGQGSITGSEGAYLARWSKTEGGVRTRVARTFVLRADAEWWLSEARRHGSAPEDPLLRDWLAAWLAGKRRIRVSTREQYRGHIDNHIVLYGDHDDCTCEGSPNAIAMDRRWRAWQRLQQMRERRAQREASLLGLTILPGTTRIEPNRRPVVRVPLRVVAKR